MIVRILTDVLYWGQIFSTTVLFDPIKYLNDRILHSTDMKIPMSLVIALNMT